MSQEKDLSSLGHTRTSRPRFKIARGRIIYIINCMSVCLSVSALAIFVDRFWNQGYLWTPYDPGMTRKYENFKFQKKILKIFDFLSEPKISLLECIIFLNWKFPSLNASIVQTKNFPPWMPLQTQRASVGRRRRPCSELCKKELYQCKRIH